MEAVLGILRGMWLTTGPTVANFERRFAEWQGVAHAVAVSSGTAALACATFASGFGPGDEVITTPLTFVATANSIAYRGATPVLADIDPRTLCISPDAIRARLTERTRGIIVVHFAGQPADMDPIMQLAAERNLIVIEDACHAPGATYRGRKVGTFGQLACYSFHPVKPITTGEGGMLVTDDAELSRLASLYRNHGISRDGRQRAEAGAWEYDMTELGQNYRLTDLHCAIGIEQLDRLTDSLARRRVVAARYDDAFRALEYLELPERPSDSESGLHLYPILLRLDKLRADRNQIFRALYAENIGVNVHYIPIHYHSWYQRQFGFRIGDFPVTEAIYQRLISLPLFSAMTDDDVNDVITAVSRVLRYYGN
jgi:dTDP-4-amino-4,6-dideoxygalactose transaminase